MDVLPALEAGDPVVVGATALALSDDLPEVATMDVDLTVSLDLDQIAAAMAGTAWSREPRLEHRWSRPMSAGTSGVSSPLRGLVDLLPSTPALLAAGRIVWPESGAEMTLAGMEAARRSARVAQLSDGSRVRIASPAAVMLLKLIALEESGMQRSKDLDHVCLLLERYEQDSERCFAPEVLEAGLAYPLVPAWLLGRDVGALGSPDDLERARRCLQWLSLPDSTQLLLAAAKGPASWDGEPAPLRARLSSFVLGLDDAGRGPA